MMNNVTLVGRLTKDVELTNTSTGVANAKFTLAVNRQFKSANGEKEVDFINVVAWRKTAEIIANYASKGSLIGITGNIQTRNYENKQGQRVYVTEVIASSVALLDSKSNNGQSQQKQDTPFNNSNQMDVSNLDLPF